MLKLHVIIASVRPGRMGLPVGTWFRAFAQKHGKFEARLVDLAEVNLPFLDEPKHPRLAEYTKPHTKAWSATIAAADAFVFVQPEYNHSAPPALFNALDFLFNEWLYKPVGFVSYGGPAMGARSVTMTKQKVVALKMMPMFESVGIPFIIKQVADGVFTPTEQNEKAAVTMLDELHRWAEALKVLRAPA
jgi:NAD(P)H-dependent FMN reductase